jgi:hypothetical protein
VCKYSAQLSFRVDFLLHLSAVAFHKLRSLAYAVVVVTCAVFFAILPLDSILESKRKCKSGNKAKTNCKVMTLVHKIKVVNTLRSGMSETSAGVLFR